MFLKLKSCIFIICIECCGINIVVLCCIFYKISIYLWGIIVSYYFLYWGLIGIVYDGIYDGVINDRCFS